ncbi:MAG: DNA topoisomerase IV, partial [Gillisia sp.]
MKKLFVACLALLAASCYSPQRNCKQFHTGTFEFQSYLNGKLVSSKFIRTDSTEIDIFEGKADTSSIRWVNDCEYILKNLHPKNMKEKKPL